MEPQPTPRRFWLIFGVVALLVPAVHLLRFFTQRTDIWWTPKPLAVPLSQSAERVQIYVLGQPLQELLSAKRVQLVTDRGPTPLTTVSFTMRFNNRDRVRADQIPGLLGAAAVVGALGVFVALSALGMWPPARHPVRR